MLVLLTQRHKLRLILPSPGARVKLISLRDHGRLRVIMGLHRLDDVIVRYCVQLVFVNKVLNQFEY